MKRIYCIPERPHDKKYHLFVCYERKSLDIVEKIVNNLELEGVFCCYYERDFLPGRSITENMYEAIEHSMNMLIVLSDELESSHFCIDEIDKAFNLRVHGQYNLIPIRIEPCSIPVCLQHIVYIDVEDIIDVAHTKIIDAMVRKDQEIALDEDKNGQYCVFGLQAYKPSCLSLTRYRLNISEADKIEIWNSQFEVSPELLQEIEDTVNGSYFMKFQHILHRQYLIASILYLYLLILIMIIFSVSLITSDREKSEQLVPTGIWLLVAALPTWFMLYMVTLAAIRICEFRCKGLFSFKRKNIQFYVMRINIKPCEVYFKRQLGKDEKKYLKKLINKDEEFEDYTTRIFKRFLTRKCAMLMDASINTRHKMKNNAKCVCLLVDEWLK